MWHCSLDGSITNIYAKFQIRDLNKKIDRQVFEVGRGEGGMYTWDKDVGLFPPPPPTSDNKRGGGGRCPALNYTCFSKRIYLVLWHTSLY